MTLRIGMVQWHMLRTTALLAIILTGCQSFNNVSYSFSTCSAQHPCTTLGNECIGTSMASGTCLPMCSDQNDCWSYVDGKGSHAECVTGYCVWTCTRDEDCTELDWWTQQAKRVPGRCVQVNHLDQGHYCMAGEE